jgi:hypothetical protein
METKGDMRNQRHRWLSSPKLFLPSPRTQHLQFAQTIR